MAGIAENLGAVLSRIEDAASRACRKPGDVKLLAVSKNFPPEAVAGASACGQRLFGENRVQELESKRSALDNSSLEWHMIGHLQSNKASRAARASDCIHSIDSLDLMRRVEKACEAEGRRIKFLLEFNVSAEESKFGIREKDDLLRICDQTPALVHAEFAGLMTMAPLSATEDEQRRIFSSLRILSEEIRRRLSLPFIELSMGMSSDFEAAIREGSTIVRIGTAIFGGRK